MKRQLSTHAAAAKMIRQEIKRLGVKARVTAKSYSGGDSIQIHVQDEPPKTVEKIKAYADQFQEGHFDGMTDCYEYSNSRDDIPQVSFVFVNIAYSGKMMQAAWEYFRNWHAGYDGNAREYSEASKWNNDVSHQVWRVLTGSQGSFWTEYKTR